MSFCLRVTRTGMPSCGRGQCRAQGAAVQGLQRTGRGAGQGSSAGRQARRPWTVPGCCPQAPGFRASALGLHSACGCPAGRCRPRLRGGGAAAGPHVRAAAPGWQAQPASRQRRRSLCSSPATYAWGLTRVPHFLWVLIIIVLVPPADHHAHSKLRRMGGRAGAAGCRARQHRAAAAPPAPPHVLTGGAPRPALPAPTKSMPPRGVWWKPMQQSSERE